MQDLAIDLESVRRARERIRDTVRRTPCLRARFFRDPAVARAQSSQDYLLGQEYVAGPFLDNPLELGMYRVGFGSYLPPTHPTEQIYWERFGRKVHKIATHVDDVLE